MTTTTQHPTLSALRGALMVMEAAEQAGLPIPIHVNTSSFAAVMYDRPVGVSWQFDTLADLAEWAKYLDAPITQHPHKGTIQHRVAGEMFDVVVELAYIEDVAR